MSTVPSGLDPPLLEKAFAKMPAVQRELLSLCAGERLTVAEAAIRLGISHEVARQRLADALCALDRMIERQNRPWWKFW